MRRRQHAILVSTAAVFAATVVALPLAHPQEREAVITGRLIAPDSSPLRGARITIVGRGQTATTDSAGRFLLRHALSGVHVIELWHFDHETLQLDPIRLPRDSMRLNAMLQRRIPSGPAGDSARTAELMRGGRGGDRLPIVLIDGVIVQRPVMGADSSGMRYPTQVDIVSIDILTGNAAMQMYGSRARYGVISIVTPVVCPRGGRGCR